MSDAWCVRLKVNPSLVYGEHGEFPLIIKSRLKAPRYFKDHELTQPLKVEPTGTPDLWIVTLPTLTKDTVFYQGLTHEEYAELSPGEHT